MRRAIRDEQKEKRRQEILDMAWKLFQDQDYPAIAMMDVAKGTGLAKGTLYLYFKTKEELFLAIQEQQFQSWFDEVDAQLAGLAGDCSVAEIAALITRSLVERPGLTRLFAILHITLEHNIEYASALAFKQMLARRITQTGSLMEACLPFLAPGQGVQLLLQAYALVIGLQHLADPAPVVRQVLEQEPELAFFKIEFEREFLAAFTALLEGLRVKLS